MAKFILALFYVIMTVFGALLGYKIAGMLEGQFFSDLGRSAQNINFLATGCVITLISIILAPHLANLFLKTTDRVVEYFHRISLQEILLGSIGLIFGLIISTLVDLVLNKVPWKEIPIIGEFIATFIYLLVTLFICYLGVYLATRIVPVPGLGEVIGKPGGSSRKRSCPNKVLDTSAIIDGRLLEIYKAGFIEGEIQLPRFILNEMQSVADSTDALKRNRGRRGLDILASLKKEVPIQIVEKDYPDLATDAKLIKLCQESGGTLLTTDFNLNKVAQLQGIRVLNVNELANALKPVFLPGEEIAVQVVREGKEHGQGVAYLDDGTMVVIEDGKRLIGRKVTVEVTSILQTVAGKMIFARIA